MKRNAIHYLTLELCSLELAYLKGRIHLHTYADRKYKIETELKYLYLELSLDNQPTAH